MRDGARVGESISVGVGPSVDRIDECRACTNGGGAPDMGKCKDKICTYRPEESK
jgi:hypothetical protein